MDEKKIDEMEKKVDAWMKQAFENHKPVFYIIAIIEGLILAYEIFTYNFTTL